MELLSQHSEKSKDNEIELREVTERDIEKIYEWRNIPEVRKWMFNEREISWEEHERFWKEYLREGKGYAFIIIYNEKKECGVVRLDLISENAAEVDIVLAPEFQGRGIGKRTIQKLIEKSRYLKLEKIVAKIKPNNISSIKIFESNGFKLVSLLYEMVIK